MGYYMFTWEKKPAKKPLTADRFEDLYLQAYPELRQGSWEDFMEAVIKRRPPEGVQMREVWGYLLYDVYECGYPIGLYLKNQKAAKQMRDKARRKEDEVDPN